MISRAYGQELLGKQQQQALNSSLLGTWSADLGQSKVQLTLTPDGRFSMNETEGNYSVLANTLTLRVQTVELAYQFEFKKDDQLTLSGGDLAQPLSFTRPTEPRSFMGWLFDLSWDSVRRKLYRIIVIALVAVACRLLILALRALSHWIIYSQAGPLKFIYSRYKNRAMTIHSLVLNFVKYVIYIIALGFVFTELGINYKAYMASLSIIGLAIGFGSQGLVQDMVTGFFIIFEGQFDVGDMVEIGPQVGIVEQLGLRMTKLHDYLGQRVVIPNRTIAAVGNYTTGAQRAYVDVAVSDSASAKTAEEVLRQLSKEVFQQFQGVIMATPKILDVSQPDATQGYVRLQVSIWPKQQWVVEQQLLPRVREEFKRLAIDIPADRIAVFYHPRRQRSLRATVS